MNDTPAGTLEVSPMAKWKSPIFSDIRNKLGENVVFSMWKGRQYMRSYTKPSNPQTVAQTANRLHMAAVVAWWQVHIANVDHNVGMWNAAALSDLISGFNLFTKTMRGVVITPPTLAHATFSLTLVSVKGSLSDVALVVVNELDHTARMATMKGVGTYTASDFPGWEPIAGEVMYVCNTKAAGVEPITVSSVKYYGMPLYYVNETTGDITEVITT